MKVKTIWEYSEQTEALRLLHAAHQISVGFYKINNFIVLPFVPKTKGLNFVTFPDLAYNTIPRFWEKVKYLNIVDLPVKADSELVKSVMDLLRSARLPNPQFSTLKNIWGEIQDKIVETIYKIMPSKSGCIKKIIIYPTAFGTGASFNWINKKGEVIMYIRQDKSIASIVEAIVTSITRQDIYKKLEGMWQESEIISDWLVTESALSPIIKRYNSEGFVPTMKGVRIKQQAKLLSKSDEFYKKLGFPSTESIFGLNGLTPEVNKKPVENLSTTEKVILKLLIQKAGGIVSFDDLGNEIFKNDQNFSLYAITKSIERLRNKLEANGVSGSYIQTLRGKGYLLKN